MKTYLGSTLQTFIKTIPLTNTILITYFNKSYILFNSDTTKATDITPEVIGEIFQCLHLILLQASSCIKNIRMNFTHDEATICQVKYKYKKICNDNIKKFQMSKLRSQNIYRLNQFFEKNKQ